MTRFEITHTTRYDYGESVSQSLNLAYVLPRNTHRQSCTRSRVKVAPVTATSLEREDYFGNRAYEFAIEQSHRTLEVTAESVVDVRYTDQSPGLDFGNTCEQLRHLLRDGRDDETLLAREFSLGSPLISPDETLLKSLRAFAGPLFDGTRPFLSATRELTQKIFADFAYDQDFSEVSTPLSDVFEHRKGVCQDFAHLAIACLRSLGFPARYISGYLETQPAPGVKKLVGADASHAWFAVFAGDGWFEFDPTNDKLAGNQHIVTAWGRDYSDVTPLRGVVFGGSKENRLNVSVNVQRLPG
jgi:transglutaminase-like putative cysteine protease